MLDGEALLLAWQCGRSWEELAQVLNTARATVFAAAWRAARRAKIRWPPDRLVNPPSRIERLAPDAFRLRERGVSFREISHRLGCADHVAQAAVRFQAERIGVPIPAARDRNAGRRLDGALALRLRRAGHRWTEIARRIGAGSWRSAQRSTVTYARSIGEKMPLLPPTGAPPRIDGARALRLRKRWRLTWTQIAKKLGCIPFAARLAAERAAKARGAFLEPRQRRTWIDGAKVAAYRRRGMPWDSIAVRLKCSKSGAQNALRLFARDRKSPR
jgi:hypothetical protein